MRCGVRLSALSPLVVLAGFALTPECATAAGGAFAVDDSEIGKPGDCEVDSWSSLASNRDFAAVTNPFCVVKLGIPVELGAVLQRTRSGGEWSTGAGVSAKINLISVDSGKFGLGLSTGVNWDVTGDQFSSGFINIPVVFQVAEPLRLLVNGGWLYDNPAKLNYFTWGAGFEWNFAKPFTLIGEVYGQAGKLPASDPAEPPPTANAITEPRTQLGLRFTPYDMVDIDLIWGHNIGGENAHWGTLGVNWRF